MLVRYLKSESLSRRQDHNRSLKSESLFLMTAGGEWNEEGKRMVKVRKIGRAHV